MNNRDFKDLRKGENTTLIQNLLSFQALCSWNVIKPRVVTKQPEERDFVRLNKMAVQAGLTSAPEQYQFRATHDVKVSSASKDRSLNQIKKIPPSMVFGVPTRWADNN
jgi:hypothetical protein